MRPHGHSMALGAYVLSWVILGKFLFDVLAGAYANSTAARALHQSI